MFSRDTELRKGIAGYLAAGEKKKKQKAYTGML